MRAWLGLTAAIALACASVACVGDDTLANGVPAVQGGSGPIYDATVDDAADAEDAAEDASDATVAADVGAGDAASGGAASGDANDAPSGDASDASSANASDAGDASDGG